MHALPTTSRGNDLRMSKMEIITNNKGGQKLCYEGYTYTQKNSSKSSRTWECSQRTSAKCKAVLRTNLQITEVLGALHQHNHDSNNIVDVTKIRNTLKQQAKYGRGQLGNVLATQMLQMPAEVSKNLGKVESIKRDMRRQNRLSQQQSLPKPPSQIDMPNYYASDEAEQLLHGCDSEDIKRLMKTFSNEEKFNVASSSTLTENLVVVKKERFDKPGGSTLTENVINEERFNKPSARTLTFGNRAQENSTSTVKWNTKKLNLYRKSTERQFKVLERRLKKKRLFLSYVNNRSSRYSVKNVKRREKLSSDTIRKLRDQNEVLVGENQHVAAEYQKLKDTIMVQSQEIERLKQLVRDQDIGLTLKSEPNWF